MKKYENKYLGALERDLDSFNRQAGLPAEIVHNLHSLFLLGKSNYPLFLRSTLLNEFVDFLRNIPEKMIPRLVAEEIVTAGNDVAIRRALKQLAIENYCALKLISSMLHSLCFNSDGNYYLLLEEETNLSDALTCLSANKSFQFKVQIKRIFANPLKYFNVSTVKNKHCRS